MKQNNKNMRQIFHSPVPELSPSHEHREEDYGAQAFDQDHNPSWRIFRIMAEFVDGFNFIEKFPKSVTFFGSARFDEQSDHFHDAQKLARLLAREGYAIVSGGGPGIMEAAKKGAVEGGGDSVGLNIQLAFEQRINPYVKKSMAFNYFFTRKVMLAYSANAFVFFPGGYGTLDEAFEMITLRQTHKINPKVPIILLGLDYCTPLTVWLRDNVMAKHKTINEDELKLWQLVDSPEAALQIITKAKL